VRGAARKGGPYRDRLFALFAGIFPRLALLILWIADQVMVDMAFHG